MFIWPFVTTKVKHDDSMCSENLKSDANTLLPRFQVRPGSKFPASFLGSVFSKITGALGAGPGALDDSGWSCTKSKECNVFFDTEVLVIYTLRLLLKYSHG